MKLYQLRYKDKFQVRTGYVEASSLEKAEGLGQEWCKGKMVRYLGIEDAILVREEEAKVPVKQAVERKAG